jgi:DNA topoisomerase-1
MLVPKADMVGTGLGNRFAESLSKGPKTSKRKSMLNHARTSRPKLPGAWRQLRAGERRHKASSGRIRAHVQVDALLQPTDSARAAGLRYVNDQRAPGIRRLGSPKRFRYVNPNGRAVSNREDLHRIKSLVIPPAWKDVWICADPRGHLQATGRDVRGRKQYRYHPLWREVRDEVKYGRLIGFARALPRIRARAEADIRKAGLPREKVLAAAVQLLEKTLIRVGNEEYARDNGSVGLTTMRDKHATIRGSSVRFAFRGKSGVEHAVSLEDARLARIVKAVRDLPGYELFQYVDDQGHRQVVDSADVNAYLREISGEDFTAKDFRTWAGTVLAAKALAAVAAFKSNTEAKRTIASAIETVAKRLGNTKAVCRKCYIHPAILEAYMDGATIQTIRARASRLVRSRSLSNDETAVIGLIERRLRKTA